MWGYLAWLLFVIGAVNILATAQRFNDKDSQCTTLADVMKDPSYGKFLNFFGELFRLGLFALFFYLWYTLK